MAFLVFHKFGSPVGKKPKRKNLTPPRKCILCGSGGLTKTHIFPDWLNRLVPGGGMRTMEHVVRSSHAAEKDIILDGGRTVKQGGLFTQKPHLLCEGCNHSLGKIEDDLVKFAKPLFTTLDNTYIDARQIRLLCAWIAVIAILSEHLSLGERTVTIQPDDLIYIKYKLAPPSVLAHFLLLH
jgi:hypothetical protein